MNYLMCWFWLDLFSSFPYGLLITAISGEDIDGTNNTASSIE